MIRSIFICIILAGLLTLGIMTCGRSNYIGFYDLTREGVTWECIEIREGLILFGQEGIPVDDFRIEGNIISFTQTRFTSGKLFFDGDRVTLTGKLFGLGIMSGEYKKVPASESRCSHGR